MSIKDEDIETTIVACATEASFPQDTIAYAILRLAEAQEETAVAILGLTEAVGKMQPVVLRMEASAPPAMGGRLPPYHEVPLSTGDAQNRVSGGAAGGEMPGGKPLSAW